VSLWMKCRRVPDRPVSKDFADLDPDSGVLTANPVVTRSYPICFYNKRPNDDEIAVFQKNLDGFLKPYMPSSIYAFGFTPNSRWMSLKARQIRTQRTEEGVATCRLLRSLFNA
jgi:hypothetical protein